MTSYIEKDSGDFMNNKVSILTPCYNSENYIGRFLGKMLDQTYNNVELVLINDGSTDRTEDIIFSYKEKIKERGYSLIYYKKENGGLGSAINVALRMMTGNYFAWCNSDDFYSNDYISENIKVFESNDKCNIVRCDGYFVYEDNIDEPYRKFSDGNTEKFKQDLFLNAITEKNFHFGCAMLRTKVFDIVNPGRNIYESREGQNWQLLLPMFYRYKSYYIDKPLFYFVNRKGSITNQTLDGNVEKKIEQQNEHEKILISTIHKMKIKEELYYLNLIKRKYILRRIELANSYNDTELIEQQKKELKSIDNIFNKLGINFSRLFIKRKLI